MSLQAVPTLAIERLEVDAAVTRITQEPVGRGARRVGVKEACAALVAARDLGWIRFEEG
jgi:hypothetical protein